jgi:hypothetical protein
MISCTFFCSLVRVEFRFGYQTKYARGRRAHNFLSRNFDVFLYALTIDSALSFVTRPNRSPLARDGEQREWFWWFPG